MFLIWTIFIFLTGLCVGSFLNVCIWRIPRRESVISPPSHCPKCDKEISWYENIPLLSWLALRGKCSNCSTPISPRYFCVELLTGLMFLSVWFRAKQIGFTLYAHALIPYMTVNIITVILIILTAFIDWDHRIIPNKVTYPALFAGLIMSVIHPALWPLAKGSSWRALTLACASVSFWTVILAIFAALGKKAFRKDALGWGDIKYIAAIAALLGPKACFFAIFAGSIIGSVAGLTLIAMKKGRLRSGIPFGPPLAIGTYLWILFGSETVAWYIKFVEHLKH